MILTYTPRDGEPQRFTFRPTDLLPAEYEPIELCGHWDNLEQFVEAVQASQRTAWRVVLWVCLRREQPDLPLDAVQPRPLDLEMTYEDDENLALAELHLADPECPPTLRAVLEANLPALRAAAGKVDGPTDPAPSATDAAPDGGTSATSSGSTGSSSNG